MSAEFTKLLPISPLELRAIVMSHGWFDLKPYHTDQRSFLHYAFDLPNARGEFLVTATRQRVKLEVLKGKPADAALVARRIFALGWDREGFHATLLNHGGYDWVVQGMHGRFLRSASLFEDLFKIILTTNTVWARTKAMNDRATELWGVTVGEVQSFPTPEAILSAGESVVKQELRCGYRAPFLIQLAERALAAPGAFLGDECVDNSPEQFCRLIRSIRGVGEVSANYVARMYGFGMGFAIDSYVERRCRELWSVSGAKLPRFLERRYSGLSSHAAHLLWFEITRHWHGEALPRF